MVKQGNGSVMVWGYFTRQRVGTLCIIGKFYYQDILEQDLQPSLNHFKLDPRCIFIYDNDSKHTSRLINDWFKRKRTQRPSPPPVHHILIP